MFIECFGRAGLRAAGRGGRPAKAARSRPRPVRARPGPTLDVGSSTKPHYSFINDHYLIGKTLPSVS